MTQVDKAVEALNERGYNARHFLDKVYVQAWTTDLESSMEIPMHPEEVKHWAEVYDRKTMFDTYTYDVAESLLPYFINDDPSGLSDEELSQCKDFLIDMNNDIEEQGKVFQHFSYETEEGNFTRCEVTGLKAMCHTLIAVAKN